MIGKNSYKANSSVLRRIGGILLKNRILIDLLAKLIVCQVTNGQGNAYTLVHIEQNTPVSNYYIKYSE